MADFTASGAPLGFTNPPVPPFTPQSLQAADELYPYDPSRSLTDAAALRAQGFTPEESAAILTLVKTRTRAEAKFGERARHLLLTEEGLSSPPAPPLPGTMRSVF